MASDSPSLPQAGSSTAQLHHPTPGSHTSSPTRAADQPLRTSPSKGFGGARQLDDATPTPATQHRAPQPQQSSQSPWQRRQAPQQQQQQAQTRPMPNSIPSRSSDERERKPHAAEQYSTMYPSTSTATGAPSSSSTTPSSPSQRASFSSSSSSFHHQPTSSMSSFGAAGAAAEAYGQQHDYGYASQQQGQYSMAPFSSQAPPPPLMTPQHQMATQGYAGYPQSGMQSYAPDLSGGYGHAMQQHPHAQQGAPLIYGSTPQGHGTGQGLPVPAGAGAAGGSTVMQQPQQQPPQQQQFQQAQMYSSSPPGMLQQGQSYDTAFGSGRSDSSSSGPYSASSGPWPPAYPYNPYSGMGSYYAPPSAGPMPPQPYVTSGGSEYAAMAPGMAYHDPSAGAQYQMSTSPPPLPGPWTAQHQQQYQRQQQISHAAQRVAPGTSMPPRRSHVGGYPLSQQSSSSSRTPRGPAARRDARSSPDAERSLTSPDLAATSSSDLGGKPPAGLRSEHVMWVGNVPANASQSELRTFFAQLPSDPRDEEEEADVSPSSSFDDSAASPPPPRDGIVSIFVIARSNCAFVNYASPSRLDRAVAFFNGRSLRPHDPRCPKLVCRVRKKSDEVQAGVGGQRGKGLHVAFLREYRRREREEELQQQQGLGPQQPLLSPSASQAPTSPSASSTQAVGPSSPLNTFATPLRDTLVSLSSSSNLTTSIGSTGGSMTTTTSSSTADPPSYTSTNSDLLGHPAFRTRYFILKSRTPEELQRSAKETGTWATQLHNEAVLAQAYRNSDRVVLVFSANGSGAFFGYAKMAGPIPGREGRRESVTGGAGPLASAATASGLPDLVVSPAPLTPHEEAQKAELGAEGDGVTRRDMVAGGGDERSATPTAGVTDATSSSHTSSLTPGDSASSDARAASQLATRAIIHNLRIDQRESQRKAELLERQLVVQESLAASGQARVRSQSESEAAANAAAAAATAGRATPGQAGGEGTATPTPGITVSSGDAGGKIEASATNPAVQGSTSSAATQAAAAAAISAAAAASSSEESLGQPFAIEWLQTRPLPFTAVKHLRNPWNENKSLRIARDGTEIAIDTAAELLALWEKWVAQQPGQEVGGGAEARGAGAGSGGQGEAAVPATSAGAAAASPAAPRARSHSPASSRDRKGLAAVAGPQMGAST